MLCRTENRVSVCEIFSSFYRSPDKLLSEKVIYCIVFSIQVINEEHSMSLKSERNKTKEKNSHRFSFPFEKYSFDECKYVIRQVNIVLIDHFISIVHNLLILHEHYSHLCEI